MSPATLVRLMVGDETLGVALVEENCNYEKKRELDQFKTHTHTVTHTLGLGSCFKQVYMLLLSTFSSSV